jgi:DNA processing protein
LFTVYFLVTYYDFILVMNTLMKQLALLHEPKVGPFRLPQLLSEHALSSIYDKVFASNRPDQKGVERDLLWAEAPDRHLITLDDRRYPERLRHIPDPPAVLFVQGSLAALRGLSLGVVGSRRAPPSSLKDARAFSETFSRSGLVVVSGLAYGIDGAAHRGAVDAALPTVAVLGCGLDSIYPAAHHRLAQDLLACGGVLVSEHPIGVGIRPYYFPKRNRIISGMSLGVLVVVAEEKSGTLVSARHAVEQGRDVFVLPGDIRDPLKAGCHRLIQEGAFLVRGSGDVLQLLGLNRPKEEKPGAAFLSSQSGQRLDDLKSILDLLSGGPQTAGSIALRLGLSASSCAALLTLLTEEGLMASTEQGYRLTLQP